MIPNVPLFGVLVDPADPATQSVITDLQAAARTLGLQLVVVNARTDSDLETAFATFSQQRVGGDLVGLGAGSLFNRRMEPADAASHFGRGPGIPGLFQVVRSQPRKYVIMSEN